MKVVQKKATIMQETIKKINKDKERKKIYLKNKADQKVYVYAHISTSAHNGVYVQLEVCT